MRVREIRLDLGKHWWEGRHNDIDVTPDTDGGLTPMPWFCIVH